MALVPKISFIINNKCDKITITEETGVYVVNSNEEGWGTPNIDTSSITDASVNIYDSTGVDLLQTFILKDLTTDIYAGVVSAPTPGAFIAFNEVLWTQTDGVYKVEYTLTDGVDTYTNLEQYELFTCSLENCLNSLTVKLVKTCDSLKIKEIKNKINQVELFLYGVQTAFASGDFTTVNSILNTATKYCTTVSDCDCGCDDC